MDVGRFIGATLITLALAGAGFYTAWWAGLIYFLNPDDAVRITALAMALAFFLVIGFVGYVMFITKPPKITKKEDQLQVPMVIR